MENYSMIFLAVFLCSVIVIIGCLASLITERRQKKERYRENRRKNLADSTVQTILGYKAGQADAAMLYRRRA